MAKTLHIILMGWEWDRVLYGLKKYPGEKVIIVCNPPEIAPTPEWANHTVKLVKRLADKIRPLFDVEIVYVDTYDFEESIYKLVDILERHSDFDKIYLNISAGPKPLIMSAVMASQYYPIDLFYVVPKKYNLPVGEEFVTKGAVAAIDIPCFNLKELVVPSKTQLKVFQEISDNISLTELVEKYAKKNNVKLNADKKKQVKSLFFYHLKNLKGKKLIDFKTEKRQLRINLTKTGKFIHKVVTTRVGNQAVKLEGNDNKSASFRIQAQM
jgi:hypothetical protein